MKQKKKKEKWMKFRHKVVWTVGPWIAAPLCRIKYGFKIEPFKERGKRPYLALLNHQTPYDQFFLGLTFKKPPVYFLATEDIFSNGFTSSVIKYLLEPIPIKKQATDVRAVLTCMRVAREGCSIAIAPEGNRTYSGRTEYINPSIVPLARKLGMPIALYRIEGGYGVEPRWSDVVRKGKIRAYVSEVIEPEEYAQLTDDELFKRISEGLYVNEACVDNEYRHARLAEYLERAVYVCPKCGLSTFRSHRKHVECEKCHMRVEYLPTKELKGEGFDFPFRFVADWYDYQSDFVRGLDLSLYNDKPMYQDTALLSKVIPYKKKIKLDKKAQLTLYGNRVEIKHKKGEIVIPFEEAQVFTVLGRNKLNIYFGENVYQFKGSKRFNALKYVNIFYHYQNILKGDKDGRFLGL